MTLRTDEPPGLQKKDYDEHFHIFLIIASVFVPVVVLVLVVALYFYMIFNSTQGLLFVAIVAGVMGYLTRKHDRLDSTASWATVVAALVAYSSFWAAALISLVALGAAGYLVARELVLERNRRLSFGRGEVGLELDAPAWTLRRSYKFDVQVTIETTVKVVRPWWMLKRFNCGHVSVDTAVQGDELLNHLPWVRDPYRFAALVRQAKARMRDKARAPMIFEGEQTEKGFLLTQILPDGFKL